MNYTNLLSFLGGWCALVAETGRRPLDLLRRGAREASLGDFCGDLLERQGLHLPHFRRVPEGVDQGSSFRTHVLGHGGGRSGVGRVR